MEVEFTDDQQAFVRQGIERGRYRRDEDAVQKALTLIRRKHLPRGARIAESPQGKI